MHNHLQSLRKTTFVLLPLPLNLDFHKGTDFLLNIGSFIYLDIPQTKWLHAFQGFGDRLHLNIFHAFHHLNT